MVFSSLQIEGDRYGLKGWDEGERSPLVSYPFPAMQVSLPQGLMPLIITHHTCLHPRTNKLVNILWVCQLEKTDHLVARGQGYSYIKWTQVLVVPSGGLKVVLVHSRSFCDIF